MQPNREILVTAEGEGIVAAMPCFRGLTRSRFHRLGEDLPGDTVPDLVIGVLPQGSPARLGALRRLLDDIPDAVAPPLILLRGDGVSGEAAAEGLKVWATFHTSVSAVVLRSVVGGLFDRMGSPTRAATRAAARVTQVLGEVFSTAGAATPEAVGQGASLIDDAIGDVGVRGWIDVVESYDDHTHRHSLLVAGLAAAFAARLGFGAGDRCRLVKAAILHDVGKVALPLALLNKAGPLSEAERRIVQTHPQAGYDMLAGSGFEDEMREVVLSHHEKLDGTGYPRRLRGREIPDLVRLVTICDIYAALIERRAYKHPLAPERAYAVLASMPGLEPALVRAFGAAI